MRLEKVREGSVQSNYSELTSKTSTHLAFSELKWFEKVRGGSRGLNHSETVYRYPTHLVTTVKMRFEKVRYSRTTPNSRQTTPNSRQRLLHTLLSLHWSGSRRFEEVRGGWTTQKQCTGTLHNLFPLWRWGSRRFGTVEPLRTPNLLMFCHILDMSIDSSYDDGTFDYNKYYPTTQSIHPYLRSLLDGQWPSESDHANFISDPKFVVV